MAFAEALRDLADRVERGDPVQVVVISEGQGRKITSSKLKVEAINIATMRDMLSMLESGKLLVFQKMGSKEC